MKRSINVLLFFLVLSLSYAFVLPKEEMVLQFPKMKGMLVNKQELELPKDIKGKRTVIVIALKKEVAKNQAGSWAEPLLTKYANQSDFQFLEIIMLSSMYSMVKGYIYSSMKSDMPEIMHDKVMAVFASLKPYKKQLKMSNENEAYVFVLDQVGEIIHQVEGGANTQKLRKVYQVLSRIK